MRPVNLIPAEERTGEHAPLRSGPLAYILVGALVAVLVGVTALVLTGNQIAETKAEITQLESEDAAAQARAERLAAYTEFRATSEARVATVQSLADSRFDWERVMRELALILPSDVWLVSLDASASGGGGDGGASLSAGIAGPALSLSGCANGQKGVAGFVTALKDIDGVTRVGVQSSELGDANSGAGAAGGGGEGPSGDDCRTRPSVAKFEIVVAFDAAPVPAEVGSEAALPSPAEDAEASSAKSEDSSAEGSEGG